jgi:phosphoglycolate phosphatase
MSARAFGLTLEESIRQLTGDRPDVDIAAIARRYRELHVSVAAPAIELFTGVGGTLASLHAAGLRLVVVSQKARRGLVQLLTQLDVDRYFDLVLASDDVDAPKPQAALFERHIAPRYPHLTPDRMLVVGDTATDLQFASNIGAGSCWAEYGYGDARRCPALAPAYTIADITELTPLCGIAAV